MPEKAMQTCVVPYCYSCWHKFAEGKLFIFHSRKPGSEPTKVWLCEDCYSHWDVVLDEEGHIALQPLSRRATAA